VPGGEVRIFFPEIVEPEISGVPEILYEDESILVADKPAGLLVHPTHSCLKNNLIHLLRRERPGMPLALAHRLDRDTSGVILLTKTQPVARAIARMFEKREVEKSYVAVVLGRMALREGSIDAPLGVSQRLQVIFRRAVDGRGAQAATTDFKVLASADAVSLVLLRPRTGRRHQIRAHLAAVGHPIAGDRLYALSDRDYLKHLRGRLGEEAGRSILADRQLLHAFRLRFTHPAIGEIREFESPLPADMLGFLETVGIGLPERIPRLP
jgi:23S rRNA pseudouridine1911/1915/1917 synthase